jgi:hypothetical protein
MRASIYKSIFFAQPNGSAKAIAAVLAGSSLTWLDLSGNKIGDEGAKVIAAVPGP